MPKTWAEMSEEEKERRREYNRQRRQQIMEAARAGGYNPEPREVLSDEERAARRKVHRTRRDAVMQAAYRRLREQGLSPIEAEEELEDLEGVIYAQGPATYLGPDYKPGMFGKIRGKR